MGTRSLIASLALLCCLSLGGPTVGQEQKPIQGKGEGKGPAVDLRRRIVELEELLRAVTRELEVLRKETKPGLPPLAPTIGTINIYTLKNTDAVEVGKTLQQLLTEDDFKTVRIATHRSTNSIIVRGNSEASDALRAIIGRLELAAADAKADKKDDKR